MDNSYKVNFAFCLANNWTKYRTVGRFKEMMTFMIADPNILKIHPFLIDYVRNQLDEAEESGLITREDADHYSNELLFNLMENREFKSML